MDITASSIAGMAYRGMLRGKEVHAERAMLHARLALATASNVQRCEACNHLGRHSGRVHAGTMRRPAANSSASVSAASSWRHRTCLVPPDPKHVWVVSCPRVVQPHVLVALRMHMCTEAGTMRYAPAACLEAFIGSRRTTHIRARACAHTCICFLRMCTHELTLVHPTQCTATRSPCCGLEPSPALQA